MGFRIQVPGHPVSIGFVRRAVSSLGELVTQARSELLALVVTELVTNAIRHAGLTPSGTIHVAVDVDDGQIRGSVRDEGIGFSPDPAGTHPNTEGGFGLVIVERVAKRWGVERSPAGTEVWFEL